MEPRVVPTLTPLSGLDAMFLYAETHATPMNVIATVVLDGRISRDEVIERVRARLPHLPQFRRRLAPTPFALDHPFWIEDATLDLDAHVLHADAPPPGDARALETVVAQVARRRLDRTRPLWEIAVVDGLANGCTALVVKAHHAAVDGVSGAAILLHLFDRPEPSADEAAAAEPAPDPVRAPAPFPGPATRLGADLARWLTRPGRYWRAARHTSAALSELTRGWLASDARDAALPFQAPASAFNGALTPERSVAYARMPVSCIDQIRHAFGGTVNDVVLAACTRALQGELWERGEPTEAPLVAAIPVSTRRASDPAGGNRISALVTRLPVDLEDPLHQLQQVKRSTRQSKRLHTLLGADTLAAWAEVLSPSLAQPAFALYARMKLAGLHRPLVNVTVSNVPGPRHALGFCGRGVHALHPHGPLMEGVGLNITVMSYAGSVDVGVLACAALLPDAHRVADRVAQALEELAKLADAALPDIPPLARHVAWK